MHAEHICELYFNMGVIYFKLGRYEESLAAYNQAFLMMLEYHDALKIVHLTMDIYNKNRDEVLGVLFFIKIEQDKMDAAKSFISQDGLNPLINALTLFARLSEPVTPSPIQAHQKEKGEKEEGKTSS